jgi:hypothetical protein
MILLLQKSQTKMHRLCITCPAILFLTLKALFQTYTNSLNSSIIDVLSYEVQYTQPLCYALFALKSLASFSPLTNFPSLIFGLTPSGWLHFINAYPLISDGIINFLFAPIFSGTKLGRTTRVVCISVHYITFMFVDQCIIVQFIKKNSTRINVSKFYSIFI